MQGCKSLRGSSCAYRDNKGHKCAIGILIPDDEYSDYFDSMDASLNGLSPVGILMLKLGYEDLDFLMALQDIHDSYEVTQWEQRFNELAEEYGLSYEPSVTC